MDADWFGHIPTGWKTNRARGFNWWDGKRRRRTKIKKLAVGCQLPSKPNEFICSPKYFQPAQLSPTSRPSVARSTFTERACGNTRTHAPACLCQPFVMSWQTLCDTSPMPIRGQCPGLPLGFIRVRSRPALNAKCPEITSLWYDAITNWVDLISRCCSFTRQQISCLTEGSGQNELFILRVHVVRGQALSRPL